MVVSSLFTLSLTWKKSQADSPINVLTEETSQLVISH